MTPSGIEPATFRFVAQHLNLKGTSLKTLHTTVSIKSVCFLTVALGRATVRQTPSRPATIWLRACCVVTRCKFVEISQRFSYPGEGNSRFLLKVGKYLPNYADSCLIMH